MANIEIIKDNDYCTICEKEGNIFAEMNTTFAHYINICEDCLELALNLLREEK